MRILVTGGAGFIGYHLCRKLVKLGHDVLIIDNLSTGRIRQKDIPVFNLDIEDLNTNAIIGLDFIFNLACPASPKHYQANPLKTLDTCYNGTLNLLKSGIPLLQASTSEIYGDPLIHPQTEDYYGNVNPIGPRSCYDEGKRIAETLCYLHGAKIVRIFNTYGPYMSKDDGRVIPNFINQALNNQPITIYGTGEQTRSLCYIDDMVDALIKAMETKFIGPINLGNPEEVTINELATRIIQLTKSNSKKMLYTELPQDDPIQRRPETTKAINTLQWKPTTTLNEGLIKTIQHYESIKS
jgi:UDP-glucuronate decarboxylase